MNPLEPAKVRGPAAATFILVTVMLGLGAWQLYRLDWKQGILAAVDKAEHAAPMTLAGIPAPFTKVSANGVLRARPFALYGAEVRDLSQGPAMGAQLLEILDRPAGPPLLVDLGWVPTDHGEIVPVGGMATITGYVRAPERPGWLSATDDPVGRHFYTLDPAAIGRALQAPPVAPMTLVAMGSGSGIPSTATALPRPVNNHLQYAVTWFALAGILAGIFIAWLKKGSGA